MTARTCTAARAIGQSKYFIGDYTVEPENGGLGVFAHEFGHDLGLPDYYDTAGGENSTAFWTLMSSGSWLGHGGVDDGIGTTPGLMGPEEKLYLGWLDYTEVNAGQTGTLTLGPSQHTYDGADQAIKVNLPERDVDQRLHDAARGHPRLVLRSRRQPEQHADPLGAGARSRVVVTARRLVRRSRRATTTCTPSTPSTTATTWAQVGQPTDGASKWLDAKRYAYAPNGKASLFRFRYQTDGGVNEAGAFLDNIAVKGSSADLDVHRRRRERHQRLDREGLDDLDRHRDQVRDRATTCSRTAQYVGYDSTLQVGPYQFSEAVTRPNWVEHFPFQDGMLVWMVDNTYADNNVSAHPGAGYAMSVDARPEPLVYGDGTRPTNRRQPFDATFGLQATDPVCLHKQVADSSAAGYTTYDACAPASAGDADVRRHRTRRRTGALPTRRARSRWPGTA